MWMICTDELKIKYLEIFRGEEKEMFRKKELLTLDVMT